MVCNGLKLSGVAQTYGILNEPIGASIALELDLFQGNENVRGGRKSVSFSKPTSGVAVAVAVP